MYTSEPQPPPATEYSPRKWQTLSSRLRRVFGVLIEKAKTTPDAYPMTVNALVAGSAVFKGGTMESYKANISAIRNAAALARGEVV